MSKQVVVIHGGSVFESYDKYWEFLEQVEIDFDRYLSDRKDWKAILRQKLPNNVEVVIPQMPSKMNARYTEWKLWFDKISVHLSNDVILVGHSLGGIFLAKYLSENKLPVSVSALFLVAAPYDDESQHESLGDFKLGSDLSLLQKQAPKVYLYHSEDDMVVPVHEIDKYTKILPHAKVVVLKDRGHVNQEDFPELINDLISVL